MAKSSAKNSKTAGRFQPGQSGNPAGRASGSKNRFTALKEAFIEAFDGIGGVEGLIAWARNNPDKFYPLLARLFPKEAEVGHKSIAEIHVTQLDLNAARRRAGLPVENE
ncbi:DUF5681 domain-containing protein [Nitrospinae bacterium]|nr:DUF5681 domain-containing protein [Nitrospinota bacterium]